MTWVPRGIYQLIEHGGAQIGGIYKVMDASKPPHWLTYIRGRQRGQARPPRPRPPAGA